MFSTLIGIYLISIAVWFGISLIIEKLVTKRYVRGAYVLESISEITTCLLFRLALTVVMNSVPAFKYSKILDVYTNKWIEVFLFLLIGYNIITLLIILVVWSLSRISMEFSEENNIILKSKAHKIIRWQRYLVYVAFGIKSSIIVF